MRAIMAIGGFATAITGAFMENFWIGIAVVVVILYFYIMITCLFNK